MFASIRSGGPCDTDFHSDRQHNMTAIVARLVGVLILCALIPRGSSAQTPVRISGFGDLQFTTDHDDSTTADFSLGQTELDFDVELSPYSSFSVAVAHNSVDGTFGLGAVTADFRWAGSSADHPYTSSWLETSGLIIGDFDIPFGLDWLVYPSIDRQLISSPAVVLHTHGQWHGIGANIYAESQSANFTAYLTDGFGHEGVAASGAPFSLATKQAVGFRAGVLPLAGIEIGVSGAQIGGVNADQTMALFGLDIQLLYGSWDFKGEYIGHTVHYLTATHPYNDGLYFQGIRHFASWYAVARYDRFSPAEGGLDAIDDASFGIGIPIHQASVLRGEYKTNLSGPTTHSLVIQMASGF